MLTKEKKIKALKEIKEYALDKGNPLIYTYAKNRLNDLLLLNKYNFKK